MVSRLPRRQAVEGLEGTRVGRYVVHGLLGRGAYSAVYRASTAAGGWCALKLVDARLQGGENLAERLRRDAAVLDRIGHPHILPIRSPMASDALTAAAMPLMIAPSLEELMQDGGLDSEQAWRILSQIADALQCIHQVGLTYRVLKPSNVLVRDGDAYLAEFGITGRDIGRVGLTVPDGELRWAQYLAPEQVLGEEPDLRADIYSFAVLVFELATATPLDDDARPSAILRRTLHDPPPSAWSRNHRIPREVDGVLRRALARDPAARQASVGELIEELACPPPPAGGGGHGWRSSVVTVDSLVDVLSGVLAPPEGTSSRE